MNLRKQFFFALSFAFMLGAFACTATDTASTDTDMTDSTQTTMPDNTGGSTDSTMNNGTGGDTTMNNDGMQNNGGAVVDSNNVPDKDGRLPVRGKGK